MASSRAVNEGLLYYTAAASTPLVVVVLGCFMAGVIIEMEMQCVARALEDAPKLQKREQ